MENRTYNLILDMADQGPGELPKLQVKCLYPADASAKAQARASVDALYALIESGLRPRDIMTMDAFENAITTAYAMGGSTNMYLHLLAIAREAGVPLTINGGDCPLSDGGELCLILPVCPEHQTQQRQAERPGQRQKW